MKPRKAIIILTLAVSLSAKHQKTTAVDLVGMHITEASFNWTSSKSSTESDVMKLHCLRKKKHETNLNKKKWEKKIDHLKCREDRATSESASSEGDLWGG